MVLFIIFAKGICSEPFRFRQFYGYLRFKKGIVIYYVKIYMGSIQLLNQIRSLGVQMGGLLLC